MEDALRRGADDLAPVESRGASADRANESIPYPPSRQRSKPTVSLELMRALDRGHTLRSVATRAYHAHEIGSRVRRSILTAGDQLHRIWPRVGDGSSDDATVS